MEVITTILLCTVGFLVYLVNANNNEVVRLKNILRDTEYLIREKEEENSNLKRQLTSEKNKLLRQPTVNGNEILSLKKQLEKNRGEISDLQKKLREKEKIISDLMSSNKKESANLENEIFELSSSNLTLEKNLVLVQNENENLKIEISKLQIALRELKRNKDIQIQLQFPPIPPTPRNPKKFVQVVFKGFSDKKHDYLLGKHKNIKVGDFVLVGTKNGAKQAKVVYISESGEFSEHAKSEIIKKIS